VDDSIFGDAVWMKDLVEEDGIYRDKLSIVTSIRSGEKHLLAHTGWVKQEVRQALKKNRPIIQLGRVILGKMILGKRQGLWKEFNEDGNKISEGHYRDNIRQGPWTFWIEETCWKTSGQMVEGKREGLWTEWSKDGSKTAEGHYLNNQKEGLWTYYNLHGVEELRQTVQMVAGERQGLEKTFWDGRKIEEGHYMDNEREGLWTIWNQEGQKEEARHYLKGVLDGPVAKWHKNGQKALEGHYKNDKLWSLVGWNPDGKKNETNLVDGNGIVIVPDWQEHRKYLYRDGKEVGGYKDGKLVMKKVYEMPAGGDEIVPRQPVVKVVKVVRDVNEEKPVKLQLTKHPYVVGYGKGEESGFSGGANPGTVRFIRLEYTGGDWDQDFGIGGDKNLLMEYHRRTGHKVAKMTESRRIMQLKNFPRGKSPPMVYMTGQRNISVMPEEIKTLREYLVDKRGMLFADNGGSNHWHRQFFNLMKQVMPAVRPVPVPLDHPIHQVPYPMSFLPYVAPHGGKEAYGWTVAGRLVAYYHPGDLGDAWADGHAGLPTQSWEACCQLGINIIFYAHAEYNKWPAHLKKSGIPTESKLSIPRVPVTGEQNATNPRKPNPLTPFIDDLLDGLK
jgi:antitoxin component YwqK of YwqJK toxin-antitoxin module